MKKKVLCPVCGNEILAGSERGRQRCRFCKRQYIVTIRRGSEPKGNGWEVGGKPKARNDSWTLEEVITGHLTKHDVKMLTDFEDEDQITQALNHYAPIKPIK